MTKQAKGIIYRKVNTGRRENKKPKKVLNKGKALGSITIQFMNSKYKDRFFGCMFKVLKDKGINTHFKDFKMQGNKIIIRSKSKSPYIGQNYIHLAIQMLESIRDESLYKENIECLIKTFIRNKKHHLYIRVGLDDIYSSVRVQQSKEYNLLSGEGERYFIYHKKRVEDEVNEFNDDDCDDDL